MIECVYGTMSLEPCLGVGSASMLLLNPHKFWFNVFRGLYNSQCSAIRLDILQTIFQVQEVGTLPCHNSALNEWHFLPRLHSRGHDMLSTSGHHKKMPIRSVGAGLSP